MSDFSELLQNAEQLTAEFDISSRLGGNKLGSGLIGTDVPRVDRSLKQLVEAGQQLFSKTKKDHAGINLGSQDVKASILLGSRGVDLPGMATKLDTLTATVTGTDRDRAFAPIEPARDTDVAGFLKKERENAILAVIEETRRDTFKNAERLHWESTVSEWEAEKQRILTDLAGEFSIDLSQNQPSSAGISCPTSTLSRVYDPPHGERSPLDLADDAERKGMFEESIRLYDLANNHEKVIALLNKLLAQVVSEPNVTGSRRDRLQTQAVEIARRYRSVGHTSSKNTTAAFFLLLDLMTFFDAFHTRLYKDALNIVSKVKIVPLSQKDVDTMVATFRLLTDEVRRTIPDVLLATMNILFTNYKFAKAATLTCPNTTGEQFASTYADGGREGHLEDLRDQARALITYAGMVPYRMPGDTNARLVQMEAQMN